MAPPATTPQLKRFLFLFPAFLLFPVFLIAQTLTGKVVGVSDGDTITVLVDGSGEKVRLAGVDCPEKKQAYGQRAKQAASAFVFGKVVNVEVEEKDRYNRWVGEVKLENGQSLNSYLVKEGYAWWYEHYAKKRTDLKILQEEARRGKKGLWQDKNPTPPWEYRRIARDNSRKKSDKNLAGQPR